MALKRSTKTIQDLIKFADDKMYTSLVKIFEQDPGIFYSELTYTANRLRTRCENQFPNMLLASNLRKLLPQSGFTCLRVTTTEIGHKFRPDWAIWLSVHEYLEKHGKELGL